MEPMPSNPLGVKLCGLFPYRWAAIEGQCNDSTAPRWKTVRKYPLKPRTLWARWEDPGQVVGVRFGHQTSYGLLDIDAGSAYLDQLPLIFAALETIGIVRSVAIRSSRSGGLHLYLPLPAPVPTFALACALRQCLEAQGIAIAQGQIECFPNVKAYARPWLGEHTEYNGHRLPLQPGTGAAILDHNLAPVGESLAEFFARWDNAAALQDVEALRTGLAIARDNQRKRPRRKNKNPVAAWRSDLELEISEGWSGPGQTNGLLKSIACYGRVFEGLEGFELARYVERIAITRSGYLEHCSHQREIALKARSWAAAAERYYWPLGTAPARSEPQCNPNAERMEGARARIRMAAAEVRLNPPATIRGWCDRIVAIARCSLETLYKHLDLWHPSLPVTPQAAGVTGISQADRNALNEMLEMLSPGGVTGNAPINEGWSLKPSPKIYPPGEGRGGRGGEGRD